MALPTTGRIKFSDINTQLGRPAGQALSWSDPAIRSLSAIASGPIRMSDLRGKNGGPPTMTQAFGPPVGQYNGRNIYQIYEQLLPQYSTPSRTMIDSLRALIRLAQRDGQPLTNQNLTLSSPVVVMNVAPDTNTLVELTLSSNPPITPDQAGQYIGYHRHTIDQEFEGSDWSSLSDADAYARILQELYIPNEGFTGYTVDVIPGQFRRMFNITPSANNWLMVGVTTVTVPDQIAD